MPAEYYDALLLVQHANDWLRIAGFERVTVSLKTEATYWRWPGRRGVIRVAAHEGKGTLAGLDAVIGRITYRGGIGHRHRVHMSMENVDNRIFNAIGRYMIMSAGLVPSTYDGPKNHAPVDQRIDRQIPSLEVAGSSPAGRAITRTAGEPT